MKKHTRIRIYETLGGNMLANGSEASKQIEITGLETKLMRTVAYTLMGPNHDDILQELQI
jgi:hypothetical protein